LSTPAPHGDFDPVIADLIRSKARRLRGPLRLNEHDLEDLMQDCHAELVQKLRHYNPARRSLDVFAGTVLRNFLSNYLRNRFAQRRDPRKVRSLDATLRSDRVPETRDDSDGRSAFDEVDLRLDTRAAVDALAPHLRELADRLTRQSVAEIARDTGIPRSTLQSRLQSVRRVFERFGLEKYLSRRRHPTDEPGK
jgi:RNA polymerase sigma-70 factor (ECF subfamily)